MFFLQDLIDFCKDIGLQSSAAATRNATVKLIGVLHKFVGPGNTFSSPSFISGEGGGPGGCGVVCLEGFLLNHGSKILKEINYFLLSLQI